MSHSFRGFRFSPHPPFPTMSDPEKITAKCWLAEVAILILAVAALRKDNPYGFYIFLRWAACPLFIWIAWKAYSWSAATSLAVIAGVFAVLYNPLLRVMLDRNRWEVINMAMIAVAIWSVVVSIKKTTASS